MTTPLVFGVPTKNQNEALPVLFLIDLFKERKKEIINNFAIQINELSKEDATITTTIAKQGTALGIESSLRYLGRAFYASAIYGVDNFTTTEVDQWLDFVANSSLRTSSGQDLEKACQHLDNHLLLRTFFVGNEPTLADIDIFFALHLSPHYKNLNSKVKKGYLNLERFLNFFSTSPIFQKSLEKDIKKEQILNNNEKKEELGAFSLQLKNAVQGKVVTRFPPEPSGYLHIGHLKAALLNSFYAEKYQGELQIRFDDTNPAKEKDEYKEGILEDLKTLEITSSRPITHTSDYFQEIQDYAEKLIKDGNGYVDDTPKDEISQQRKTGKESINRNNSVSKNLEMWKEMTQGTPLGQTYVLRAKINMTHKNSALRDPALYRCLNIPHPRTKNKFKSYPLYDFACPIVDSKEGVTHALRSNEYNQRNDLYNWVLKVLNLKWVNIEDFSRVNFTFTLLGKRHLRWFVENGHAENWDDPRFPTIRGFLRRGMTVEAMRKFILQSAGASKNVNLMEVERVWAINKQIIDPIVPRYTAIVKENRFTLLLKDGPEKVEYLTKPRHPKNPDVGEKIIPIYKKVLIEGDDAKLIKQGEEVTLKDWGNCIIDGIDLENKILTGTLNLKGDFKKTEKKITFIADTENIIDITLVEFDTLTTKEKPEEGDDITTIANLNSIFHTPALGDSNLKGLSKGDIVQLERRGYWKIDVPFISQNRPMILFNIPDGHTKKQQSVLSTKVHSKGFVDIGQSKKAKQKEAAKKGNQNE